ncbi:MAG: hypothetical protein EHM93_16640 [Bacteroidales bacterium]|nr:MAG: hypothetical protein EHM93_16640 [Bacteroidales bacterium]
MNKKLIKHKQMKASERDEKSPVWDMSQERAFIENLLSQRFNYFLLFYSIVIAGFVKTTNLVYAQLILTLGAIITILFALVLERSQQKLDIILKDLFEDDSHPAKIVDDLAGGCSRRRIIGIWIPKICYWTLVIGAIAHLVFIIFFNNK